MARGRFHWLRRGLVLAFRDAHRPPDGRRLDRHELSNVRRALEARPDVAAELCNALGGGRLGVGADRTWRSIEGALRDGRLLAFEIPETPFRVGQPGEEPQLEFRPIERKETTWVGIELCDQDGEPVSYQRVHVVLPSGERRDLMLDEHGKLRLVGIDPGECEVSFPDLDGRDWRPA